MVIVMGLWEDSGQVHSELIKARHMTCSSGSLKIGALSFKQFSVSEQWF